MLDIGTTAPEFSVGGRHGETVALSDHRGSWVALWWYPKASTPG